MCVVQTRVLFLNLSGDGRGRLSVYNKSLLTMLEEWAGWCAKEGVLNNVTFALNFAIFLVHLFRVGMVWCTIVIYWSAISPFLKPHCHHKALNDLIISK